MSQSIVYACVIVAALCLAVWIEHKRAILTMLGLQSDERD